jgi:predicted O-methyltransferase YrrM
LLKVGRGGGELNPCNKTPLFEAGFYEKIGFKLFDELGCREYRKKYSCPTSPHEMSFLIGLIDKYRFSNGERIKRVLEVGVFNGGTALALLKQGRKNDGFYLYGIDKAKTDFHGAAVFNEATKEELEHYELHKGSTTADIENILKDKEKLDMIFIDARHEHPFPLIDLIYLIPFLRKDALICMHDTLSLFPPSQWGPGYIYLLWDGQKYRNYALDGKLETTYEQSMGCIVANQGKEKLYKDLLAMTKIPLRADYWSQNDIYLDINEMQIEYLRGFMLNHYDEFFAHEISDTFLDNLKDYRKAWPLYFYEKHYDVDLYNTTKTMRQKISHLEKELNKINDLRKNIWRYRIKYFRYVVASKITFGKTRQKYKVKRELLTAKLYS